MARVPGTVRDAGSRSMSGSVVTGKSTLILADCFEWLADCEPCSIQAVVTDPPYGLVEYSEEEQAKLRKGRGGVWRLPPSFDGHRRAPLPRFTVLDGEDRLDQAGDPGGESHWGQSLKRRRIKVMFCPPKPKLLDRATSTSLRLATLGT